MGSYNRDRKIPGVSGKRVPGTPRLPGGAKRGGTRTNVGFQQGSGGQWGSAIFREYHRQQIRDSSGRFGGGWGFAWVGLEAVDDFIYDALGNVLTNLKEEVEKLKDEMVEYMKENAPWTDHPGENRDARENLQGAVIWDDAEHFTIMLGHGANVYYGIWLEVRWGGRYAIVVPTLEHYAPILGTKLKVMT